ncbi:MAG: nucleotidyltransferase family protein [bacterium]|nr:nucleotidyltransferase family protein [bacterium]
MSQLEVALHEVSGVLESLSLPHMLIGGLAVAMWGTPRSTLDVDVSVWIDAAELAGMIGRITTRLPARVADPVAFSLETRVLPVETAGGVRADIVLASLPFEYEMIRRAVRKEVGSRFIPVASAEDLILMKAISEREKDLGDVRGLIRANRKALDLDYLRPRLQELADGLGRPEIVQVLGGELGAG